MFLFCILLLNLTTQVDQVSAAEYSETVLFQEDTDGFKLYRIPGIVVTSNGPNGKPSLLYSAPYTTERQHQDRRDVTIYRSQDDGKTWPQRKTIFHGPSAYSDLAVLHDGQILCFYEQGVEARFGDHGRPWAYRRLVVAKFDLTWLQEK
ncbi:MAG: hypothetical protein ACKN9S_11755 [Pirellula sp.]